MHGDMMHKHCFGDTACYPLLSQPYGVWGGSPARIDAYRILAALESELFGQLTEGKLRGDFRLGLRSNADCALNVILVKTGIPDRLHACVINNIPMRALRHVARGNLTDANNSNFSFTHNVCYETSFPEEILKYVTTRTVTFGIKVYSYIINVKCFFYEIIIGKLKIFLDII